jgi:hypothetical protein
MTTDKQGKLMALQSVFTGSLLWPFLVFVSLSFVGTSIQLFGQTATPTPAGPDTTESLLIHYGDLIDVDDAAARRTGTDSRNDGKEVR